MKYLKHFESGNTKDHQDHILAIKDVFQDVFDDWNIEELNKLFGRHASGLYWNIFHASGAPVGSIYQYWLQIMKYDDVGRGIDIPPIDVSGHVKTLQSMGYRVAGVMPVDGVMCSTYGNKLPSIVTRKDGRDIFNEQSTYIRLLIYIP